MILFELKSFSFEEWLDSTHLKKEFNIQLQLNRKTFLGYVEPKSILKPKRGILLLIWVCLILFEKVFQFVLLVRIVRTQDQKIYGWVSLVVVVSQSVMVLLMVEVEEVVSCS